MKKPQFVNGEIYHIYNRGVEKRNIFSDEQDYFRFIHDLFEFNDSSPAGKFSQNKFSEAKPQEVVSPIAARKLLVEIWCFCLMPNHFHLILKQIAGNGIILFMQKLGTGYTMYFNEKYQRVGHLSQGPFKAKIIENEDYLKYLSCYIHLNPLELIHLDRQEGKIRGQEKASEFLESYRWSSYLDYLGRENFPSVTSRHFINNRLFNVPNEYKEFINGLLTSDFNKIKDLTLE